MLKKRWFEKGSNECLSQYEEPATPQKMEPETKKQRQSVIKSSAKRIFSSVTRLFQSRKHEKKHAEFDAFQPQNLAIKKSAALQEAEVFLERLGPNWTIDQLEARIKYLYHLVNDSFERAYLNCLKDGSPPIVNLTSTDYMTEIRNLQRMTKDRRVMEAPIVIDQPVEHLSCVPPEELSIGEAEPVPVIVNPDPVVISAAMDFERAREKIKEGIECNGVKNEVGSCGMCVNPKIKAFLSSSVVPLPTDSPADLFVTHQDEPSLFDGAYAQSVAQSEQLQEEVPPGQYSAVDQSMEFVDLASFFEGMAIGDALDREGSIFPRPEDFAAEGESKSRVFINRQVSQTRSTGFLLPNSAAQSEETSSSNIKSTRSLPSTISLFSISESFETMDQANRRKSYCESAPVRKLIDHFETLTKF